MFKAFLISIGTIILGIVVVIVTGLGSAFKLVGKGLKAIFKRGNKDKEEIIEEPNIKEEPKETNKKLEK